ncbi:Cullin repeat-like-containing domain protein [Globomyces pollinis-pini]|nr:Cullin repeat-like-containing domain protein [Globomyces pollinis-pini]
MVVIKLNSNPTTEAQIEKRKQLEKKLEQDIKDMQLLQGSLELADDATKRATNMLNSFDTRLAKLESFILPIHEQTQSLTRTNINLDIALNIVTAYTNVVEMINYHENVVEKGLGATTLELYIESVEKLKESLHQLESSNYRSSERITQDLRGKLSKGIQELDELFKKVLTNCTAFATESDIQSFQLPLGVESTQLITLTNVLSDSLEQIGPVTGFLKIYSDIRAKFLSQCLATSNALARDQEVKFGYSRIAYQKGSSLLLPYANSLLSFLQAEYTVATDVVPKQHVVNAYTLTITPAVDAFLECTETLLNRVKKSLQKRDANDLYMLIDIYEGLHNLTVNQDLLLAHCGKKGFEIRSIFSTFATTIVTYFKEYYEELKIDPDSKKSHVLSQDGTVHETTSMTMNAVRRIHDNVDAIKLILDTNKGIYSIFPCKSISDYIHQLIDLLMSDLENKSKSYKKPVLAALFMLNNANYIIKSVKGTPLYDLLDQNVIGNIDRTMKKQLENYRGTWVPLIEHLMDNAKINDGKIEKVLTKAQREIIKDKFKNFNKDFEEIYTTQKAYAIPDVELRASVIKEVKAILCPMYNRFYDRYTTNIEFTKNIDKYVKYNKEELSSQVDKFFDASS